MLEINFLLLKHGLFFNCMIENVNHLVDLILRVSHASQVLRSHFVHLHVILQLLSAVLGLVQQMKPENPNTCVMDFFIQIVLVD